MLVLTAVQYDVRKNEQKRQNLAIRDLKLLSNIKHLQRLACAEDLIHSHINDIMVIVRGRGLKHNGGSRTKPR